MNVQHSSRTDNWATPSDIINLVHEVIGYPNIDPASSHYHNLTVKADTYFDEKDDALTKVWFTDIPGSVYCNPPGGKLGNKSMTKLFWSKLMEYRNQGLITEAIFMCFSVESMQNTQSLTHSVTDFPVCIPSKRIKFISECGQKNQPSHSNCIVYVPGLLDNTDKFKQVFRDLGAIMVPG